MVRLGVADFCTKFDSVLNGRLLVGRMRHRCATAAKLLMVRSLASREALSSKSWWVGMQNHRLPLRTKIVDEGLGKEI